MQIKVLVVDDSRFYRNRLCEILGHDKNIQVIDTAENGREAIDKVIKLKPDVITMDIEMPELDGISAVREIMKKRPTPILMLSSMTAEGAQATFDALEAGAVDFLLKKFDKFTTKNTEFIKSLHDKIHILSSKPNVIAKKIQSNVTTLLDRSRNNFPHVRKISKDGFSLKNYKVVAIGASTGGPVAIQSILMKLPKFFPVPIIVIQHMPASFTYSFAHRMNTLSELYVKEAENGDVLKAGNVYVAPGGKQMILENKLGNLVVKIRESYEYEQYKPSLDSTFKSASDACQDSVLAIVLTGMGADGRKGSEYLKGTGSAIWAQDEQTSVVFGMPQAVIEAGLADRVYSGSAIADQLVNGI